MALVERIKVGNRQTIDTLISEEALLFAKYLRHEKINWMPRLPSLTLKPFNQESKKRVINPSRKTKK